MIYISQDGNGAVINLTVGDDASLVIGLVDDDGLPYEMGEEEYLIFSVREKPSEESELLIEIQSDLGSNEIDISHENTVNLSPGFYSAEVQLMTADSKRITVWPKLTGNSRTAASNRKNFCLMTEVVYR
jgi:hypothetical protein